MCVSTYFDAADSKSGNRFAPSGLVFYLWNTDVHKNNPFIAFSVVALLVISSLFTLGINVFRTQQHR